MISSVIVVFVLIGIFQVLFEKLVFYHKKKVEASKRSQLPTIEYIPDNRNDPYLDMFNENAKNSPSITNINMNESFSFNDKELIIKK